MKSNQPAAAPGQALPGSFVDHEGKLYIRVRKVQSGVGDEYTTRTAVYPSVKAYNNRSAIPHYVELSEVANRYEYPVEIDLQFLLIRIEEPTDHGTAL